MLCLKIIKRQYRWQYHLYIYQLHFQQEMRISVYVHLYFVTLVVIWILVPSRNVSHLTAGSWPQFAAQWIALHPAFILENGEKRVWSILYARMWHVYKVLSPDICPQAYWATLGVYLECVSFLLHHFETRLETRNLSPFDHRCACIPVTTVIRQGCRNRKSKRNGKSLHPEWNYTMPQNFKRMLTLGKHTFGEKKISWYIHSSCVSDGY